MQSHCKTWLLQSAIQNVILLLNSGCGCTNNLSLAKHACIIVFEQNGHRKHHKNWSLFQTTLLKLGTLKARAKYTVVADGIRPNLLCDLFGLLGIPIKQKPWTKVDIKNINFQVL